jgi:indole-3-glycerol phosphate synthase
MRALKRAEVQAIKRARAAGARFSEPIEAGAFLAALSAPGRMAVIAEIKRASPSAGAINTDLDAVALARTYQRAGASAISVLTEAHYFGGSLDDLEAVSQAVDIPVLRKDFICDEVQIDEALARGASAVLLIAAFVDAPTLARLVAHAFSLGLEPLVEVHLPDELPAAVASGARVLGVNARDLRSLEVDRSVVLELGPALHAAGGQVQVTVAESGIREASHARAAWLAGYRAVLVGEALVRHRDPGALVAEFADVGGEVLD